MSSISSLGSSGSSYPTDPSDPTDSSDSEDITQVETDIADGDASPLDGLDDWSCQGILDRLTGQDGVLENAAAIQQGADPSTLTQNATSAASGLSDSGSQSPMPSNSATSTVSAMSDSSV